jgi:hypothetical protein
MFAAIEDRAPLRRVVVLIAVVCPVALASACAVTTRPAPSGPPSSASVPATVAAHGPVAQAAAAVPKAQGEGYLTAIRVARHPAYDRVVFQFAGGMPGYSVRYVTGVTADPSARPVPLPGRAYLQVVFRPASEIRQNPSGSPPTTRTYTGPSTLTPLLPTLLQVRAAGDFEGYLSFGIGVSGRAPVRAFTLTGPDRVVLDIGHVRLPRFPGIWDVTSWRRYWAAQSFVEQGHQTWLLSPSSVVAAWAASWASHAVVRQIGPTTFEVRKPGTSQTAVITGARPVTTGPAPIWVITRVTSIA